MIFPDLLTRVLNLNIALLQLAEKLNERGLGATAKYMLKHGVRVSDYVHRSRRNLSKYKCITNFKLAVHEIDKTMCLLTHLHKRSMITEEEYEFIYSKCDIVRMSVFIEIRRYSRVADWYEFKETD